MQQCLLDIIQHQRPSLPLPIGPMPPLSPALRSGLRRAGPVSAYGNGNGNGYGNGSVAYAPSPSTIASTTTEFSMQPELFSL